MSITPAAPVLNSGDDTSMRLDGEDLYLTQVDFEHRIPLKAIAVAEAGERTFAITLKSRWEDEPAVFRIGDVDTDEAAAFARAVLDALPEPTEGDREVNGVWVVASRDIPAEPPEGLNGFQIGAITVVLLLAGCATYAGIMGGFWPITAVLIVGGITAFVFAAAVIQIPATALAWSLPKRGVKAVAAYSHNGQYKRLHLYTDKRGNTRTFPGLYSSASTWAPKDIEVVYDPEAPGTVLRADEGRWGKVIGLVLLGALSALGLAGTVLLTLGYGL
ncbi:hypothetical protein [Phytomonospora endophytica]|uniref:DUF3592 domain-containing protein n=1 Tax=Phytomonospora endophytica TaxID=714109 RepID=A0A841FST1_9ACTN|nr:hypothetical protein [Phytomonospora endophytica]MBB6035579.1 hypothetical protein [Phytomonospora endophytica]GIG70059.1 hypothetical protein Pen01_63540 [Phytomonospora endophytica]